MAHTDDKKQQVAAEAAAEEMNPGNDIPETSNEPDGDEQVHARRKEVPSADNEMDADDVVHQKNIPAANTDFDLQDPDDLVHDTTIRE